MCIEEDNEFEEYDYVIENKNLAAVVDYLSLPQQLV
jgi:hypothetical protein